MSRSRKLRRAGSIVGLLLCYEFVLTVVLYAIADMLDYVLRFDREVLVEGAWFWSQVVAGIALTGGRLVFLNYVYLFVLIYLLEGTSLTDRPNRVRWYTLFNVFAYFLFLINLLWVAPELVFSGGTPLVNNPVGLVLIVTLMSPSLIFRIHGKHLPSSKG